LALVEILWMLTSGVGVDTGLVVLCGMVWNAGYDDDPVVVIDEGFIVGVGLGGVSADGRSCSDGSTCSGINQSLHFGGILKVEF